MSPRVWFSRPVLFVYVLVALSLPCTAHAVDDGPSFSGTVDCSDSSTSSSCIECCSGQPGCTFGKITCCPLTGDCTVTGGGGGKPPPLKLAITAGGMKLQFERKLASDGDATIKLKVSFLKKVFVQKLSIKAQLSGSDARIGGLLFPIVFLGQGSSAEGSLQGAGYDVTVTGSLPTCQSIFPDQLCSELATALSRAIYGALGVGIRTEVQEFLDGTNGFGFGPCQSFG